MLRCYRCTCLIGLSRPPSRSAKDAIGVFYLDALLKVFMSETEEPLASFLNLLLVS